ncbi:MAG: hypothetical protein K0Q87_4855 [Neobacillus sp.]|jgi:predicted lipoprotein|nr:hypothetical protein [Neobacillus sp.]
MNKRAIAISIVLSLFMIFSLTGCVKVVQIGHEGELTGNVAFNATENVAGIWQSKAIPELEKKAIDLPKFLNESNGDLKSLASKYGKYSMGKSGELSYVVKGIGKVTEVNQEKKTGYMTVKLNDYNGPTVIKLQIGSVYRGSAVRDSLDFIKYEDYKNQVEWAKVSQSVHDVINSELIQKSDLDSITGKDISFVGCFSVDKPNELLITPVELTVQ